MFCPKCGAAQNDSSTFCPECGTRLSSAMATPPPPPPAGKRGGRRVLVGVAAVALLGLATLLAWMGASFIGGFWAGFTGGDKPGQGAAGKKGLAILFNGLEAASAPLPDMKQVADHEGVLHFVRPDDRKEVLGVPVEDVTYLYAGGRRLWSVQYRAKPENAAALLEAMKRENGEADWKDPDGFLHWFEPKGDRKNYVLSAAYVIEENGEAGISVISDAVSKQLVEQVMNEETTRTQSESPAPEAGRLGGTTPGADSGQSVFTATFACMAPPDRTVPVAQCFTESSIKITRGNRASVYSMYQIHQAVGTGHSVTFELPSSFQIEAQNSAPFDSITLSLTITETATGKVVFEDQAARWNWVMAES